MQDNRLYKTAIHEAGHVAAALHFGFRFKYVTVLQSDDALGHVMLNSIALPLKFPYQKRTLAKIYNICAVLLAGDEAETIHFGFDDNAISPTDQEECKNLLYLSVVGSKVLDKIKDVCKDEKEIDSSINKFIELKGLTQIEEHAKKVLLQPHMLNFVKELASLLYTKQKMSYKECTAIYKRCFDAVTTNETLSSTDLPGVHATA